MKLLLGSAVTTVLGLWMLGTPPQETPRVDEPGIGAPTAAAADTPSWEGVTAEDLRALYEMGTPGITTHRVNPSRPEGAAAALAEIECGSAEGGVTGPVSSVQCAGGIVEAMAAATSAVEFLIAVAHPNDCQKCPFPGGCEPSISTLDSGWSFGMPYQNAAGNWCIKATFKGAYLYVCSSCFD